MSRNIKRLEHELFALKASLERAYHAREISGRQFHSRMDFIKSREKDIAKVKALTNEPSISSSSKTILDLNWKNLPDVNENEEKQLIKFLEEKHLFLHSTFKSASRTLRWLAVTRKGGIIHRLLVPWRLNWINIEIKKLDQKIQKILDAEIEYDQLTILFAEQLLPYHLKKNNKGIHQIFSLIRYHQQLLQDLGHRQQEISQLQEDLAKIEQGIPAGPTPELYDNVFPKSEDSRLGAHYLAGEFLESIDKTKHRLQRLINFLYAHLNDESASLHLEWEAHL